MSTCPIKEHELETVRLMADGKTADEIAKIAGLTKWAIQRRIGRMLVETGAVNSTNLVAISLRNKWVQ